MIRKTVLIALFGALFAGLCCLTVGLILFFVMKENAIVVICSFFAICMGAGTTAVAGVAVIITLVITKLNSSKNKEENGEKNDG